MVPMKKCCHCKTLLRLDMFFRNKSNKDGYSYVCKKCQSKSAGQRVKEWREKYPLKLKQYREKNPYKFWASNTINGHRRKGFVVNIEVKDLEEDGKRTFRCSICECPLSWEKNKIVKSYSPTLDRTDNSNVLSTNNTQIVCHKCNTTKSDRTM